MLPNGMRSIAPATKVSLSGAASLENVTDENYSSRAACDQHPDTFLPQDQQVEQSHSQVKKILTHQPARIITNQPLRAKEASPFVSSKYPVIVCRFWSVDIVT